MVSFWSNTTKPGGGHSGYSRHCCHVVGVPVIPFVALQCFALFINPSCQSRATVSCTLPNFGINGHSDIDFSIKYYTLHPDQLRESLHMVVTSSITRVSLHGC